MGTMFGRTASALGIGWEEKHGPLPVLLFLLTVVTGIVDAVSYLKLGHVFVANMTGNVVFLGFAVAGTGEFSVPASLAAVAAFLVGALLGGRISVHWADHRGRLIATVSLFKIVFIGAAFILALLPLDPDGVLFRYGLVALLGLAMGLQNAAARRLGVPDMTTTVLTLTMTGIAADSSMAGGSNIRIARRLVSIGAIFLGAALGAISIHRLGVAWALGLALALVIVGAVIAFGARASAEPWVKPL